MFLNRYLFFLFYIFFSFSILIADENELDISSVDSDSVQKIINNINELEERHTVLTYFTDGMFIATEQNHPELHNLIDNICNKLEITKPLVLVHVGSKIKKLAKRFAGNLISNDSTFNTFAYGGVIPKINKTVGIICFSLDTLKNVSKDDLECIIAHELSHLKYNHIPIKIALNLILFSGFINLFLDDIGKTLFTGKTFSFFTLASNLPVCNTSLSDRFILMGQNFLLRLASFGFIQRIDECDCCSEFCSKVGSFYFFLPGAFAFADSWFLRLSEKEADLSAARALDNEEQMQEYLEGLLGNSNNNNNKLIGFYNWLKKYLSLPFLGIHPTLEQRIQYLDEFENKNV